MNQSLFRLFLITAGLSQIVGCEEEVFHSIDASQVTLDNESGSKDMQLNLKVNQVQPLEPSLGKKIFELEFDVSILTEDRNDAGGDQLQWVVLSRPDQLTYTFSEKSFPFKGWQAWEPCILVIDCLRSYETIETDSIEPMLNFAFTIHGKEDVMAEYYSDPAEIQANYDADTDTLFVTANPRARLQGLRVQPVMSTSNTPRDHNLTYRCPVMLDINNSEGEQGEISLTLASINQLNNAPCESFNGLLVEAQYYNPITLLYSDFDESYVKSGVQYHSVFVALSP